MREIKFRAWADGKMHYQGKDQWWMFSDSGFWALGSLDPEGCNVCDNLESKNPVLMQYTGLKDIEGTDIYEDDIVFVDSFYRGDSLEKHRNGIVAWNDGGYAVFLLGSDDYHCELDTSVIYNYRIRVIGNQFKNHGLLEPK